MADGREDERANFQFIEEVQNCSDLWNVLSAAYKDTKTSKFDPFAKKFLNAAASSARSSWTSVLYAPRVGFLLI